MLVIGTGSLMSSHSWYPSFSEEASCFCRPRARSVYSITTPSALSLKMKLLSLTEISDKNQKIRIVKSSKNSSYWFYLDFPYPMQSTNQGLTDYNTQNLFTSSRSTSLKIIYSSPTIPSYVFLSSQNQGYIIPKS